MYLGNYLFTYLVQKFLDYWDKQVQKKIPLILYSQRIHKEYKLPFAEMGLQKDLREIKKNKEFSSKREEILSMIWNMEEEIMGKEN